MIELLVTLDCGLRSDQRQRLTSSSLAAFPQSIHSRLSPSFVSLFFAFVPQTIHTIEKVAIRLSSTICFGGKTGEYNFLTTYLAAIIIPFPARLAPFASLTNFVSENLNSSHSILMNSTRQRFWTNLGFLLAGSCRSSSPQRSGECPRGRHAKTRRRRKLTSRRGRETLAVPLKLQSPGLTKLMSFVT
jgi:hypothetical protein